MQSLRKKLCSGAYGGLKDLQSVATRIAARREISGLSGGFVARESSWVAPVLGSGVPGAPSRVERRNSGLGKTKAEPIAVTEAWRIGGVRRMGITTRPGDRAAEHGVRSPLTNAEGSPEWIEEQRQDEFLRGSKRAAASKVEQVEEAVGGEGGASFEAADAETKSKLGMNSDDAVRETAGEFTRRSQSRSEEDPHPAVRVDYGAEMHHGIDEEVHRGLVADSEHPAGRVVKEDDPQFSQPEGEADEDVMTGVLGDWAVSKKEAQKDRTDKVHPYSADKLYSTDEALDKGQVAWEKGTTVESGAPKLVAEDHEKSEGVYGSFKPPL
ncbi:hypothetical protein MPTK1_7g19430 [Marchantia polymorpha subsp. ruderalis]|uniref:Uncharacterized protein n=2 Tax=Marchantia polymorpha TaxID=3197 RepID=A0AAF6C1F8_MARPO|nr:hypothetical protein MARPO_0067s0035 [Marchantia polymorpha]BBN18092.1 hypothetical protein Mp_7g19430 [Marchantia polymorpha subsp. ruderalis]|eukprot:PTQ35942.1 hypothetical protein MARPO_0067s0035 [Marchantia polymorpha]